MRQVYMGSDHHVQVGSFPKQGVLDSDHTGSVLGFMLMHDIEGWRRGMGGSHRYTSKIGGVLDDAPLDPNLINTAVGIRLCVDWTQT